MDFWRYARHLSLDGVGERGQARLAAASVVVSGDDAAAVALARRYLEAGGVGEVSTGDPSALHGGSPGAGSHRSSSVRPPSLRRQGGDGGGPAWPADAVADEASRSVVRGSLLTLDAMRSAIGDGGERA